MGSSAGTSQSFPNSRSATLCLTSITTEPPVCLQVNGTTIQFTNVKDASVFTISTYDGSDLFTIQDENEQYLIVENDSEGKPGLMVSDNCTGFDCEWWTLTSSNQLQSVSSEDDVCLWNDGSDPVLVGCSSIGQMNNLIQWKIK